MSMSMSVRAASVATRAMAAGASQDIDELALAVQAVEALAPAVVVEIGCDRGGTLLAWRFVCPRVYGITLPDNGYDTGGSGLPLEDHGAQVYLGDSHSSAALDWLIGQLAREADGQWELAVGLVSARTVTAVDVLVIDGDHTPDGVRMDLQMYGPLVRPGGLILLHDVCPSTDPRSQVWRVWPDLAAAHKTQVIDCGGPGWGVIHVQETDRFGPPDLADC